MAKQSQPSALPRAHKSGKSKGDPARAGGLRGAGGEGPKLAEEPAGFSLPALPQSGPGGVFEGDPAEQQAARLGDARWLSAQRVSLAGRIGRAQGNQHLQSVLARATALVQRAGGGAAALTQAGQEAKATQTMTRLRDIHRRMLRHANRTVRNTAQLFVGRSGNPPRLHFNAMTLRSDSASRVQGLPAALRAESAYYFYGLTQNNAHRHGPNTIGTVQNDTILIRGRDSSGHAQSEDGIMGTMAHEASHILVASYGEHPHTSGQPASFDRYKDEFRAYWIEPVGHWAEMPPNDTKARAIRDHLVGTSATDTGGYPDLRQRYWSDAAFKTQVDNHRRPDGFNLSNDPNLDRLFQLLNGARTGTPPTAVERVLAFIIRTMSPAQRAAAAASTLIRTLTRALVGDDATRVENALTFPRTAEQAAQLNPTNSPRMTALLEAIAVNDSEAMKNSYRTLTAAEQGRLAHAPAPVMVFIDRQLSLAGPRASVYAMVLSRQVAQFDAMESFLGACLEAQIDAALGALTQVPPAIRTSLRRLVYPSRLALYRLVEDARREYVDALPDPVKSRILHALREGGEPE